MRKKKVKNIVHYVTRQYMKKNKRRTATTLAGIVLMVLLMTCVFVGKDTGIAYLETLASQRDGKYHAAVYGISQEKYEELKALPYVRKTAVSVRLGDTLFEASANTERPFLNVKGYTADCYDWMNISLTEGRLPQNDAELVLSRGVVDDGAQIAIGDKIEAQFFTRSLVGLGTKEAAATYFPFSGFSIHAGETVDVPENFPFYGENDSFREEHTYTGERQTYEVVGFIEAPSYEAQSAAGYTAITTLTEEQVAGRGQFNVSIMFDQERLPDMYYAQWEERFAGCEFEINDLVLGFSASSSNTTMNLVVKYMSVLFTVLIMTVSVVLICNVFHISFRERSRYLGMLCSVGATGRQKRSSIYFEAFYLLLFGLPLGIALGIGVVWAALTLFAPWLVEFIGVGYDIEPVAVQIQLSLHNLAAVVVLSIFTVLLSAYLPARKIGKTGPLESIRGNTERKSRTYKTGRHAIRLLGAEGLLAFASLTRRSQKTRAVSRAATVFLILLVATAFGAGGIHQVMEKKLSTTGINTSPELYDYVLYAAGAAGDGEDYEALKREIAEDVGVERIMEWYMGLFVGHVNASVYSDAYWDAVYDIFNLYHHGTLTREVFEQKWKNESPSVNMLSVDEATFGEMAQLCGADADSLKENSVLILNDGEFSTDTVGIAELEPERYRYYHLDNMTDLQAGDEFEVRFYSDQKEEYVSRRYSVAGHATAGQLERYLTGSGDYYFWIITGPEIGKDITELTRDAEGYPYMTQELLIRLNGRETDLIQRLSTFQAEENGAFQLLKAGYIQSIERSVAHVADAMLLAFVVLSSSICLLNLFNSVRGWIQESAGDYRLLRSAGMTGKQMRRLLLLQCGGIFLRAFVVAAFGVAALVAVIRFGIIAIFGNLILPLPVGLCVLSILAVGAALVVFSFGSLKKEIGKGKEYGYDGIAGRR